MPSGEDDITVSYGSVCEVIEGLVERRASMLGPDVRTVMVHYTQMLRRYIVG